MAANKNKPAFDLDAKWKENEENQPPKEQRKLDIPESVNQDRVGVHAPQIPETMEKRKPGRPKKEKNTEVTPEDSLMMQMLKSRKYGQNMFLDAATNKKFSYAKVETGIDIKDIAYMLILEGMEKYFPNDFVNKEESDRFVRAFNKRFQ